MIPPTFTASGQPAIPGPWTKSGRTIVKPSSAPTSSTSIRPGTNSNTSAGGKHPAFPTTPNYSKPGMLDLNSPQNWIVLGMKSFLMILISLSAWGILLYGLCWGLLGFGSFGAQPLLALIALVGISFCALTILALFTGNGSCDPQ